MDPLDPLAPLTPEPVRAEPLDPPPNPPLVDVVGEPEELELSRPPDDDPLEPAPATEAREPVEELLSRLRNAVTSPPVDTIPATDQPSDDFSVSFVARAAGSYDDALTVVNSCMGEA